MDDRDRARPKAVVGCWQGLRDVTAKQRLVPDAEVRAKLDIAREYGIVIGAIDIRSDGVTIHQANQSPGNDFDRWLSQDKGGDAHARRQ